MKFLINVIYNKDESLLMFLVYVRFFFRFANIFYNIPTCISNFPNSSILLWMLMLNLLIVNN